MKIQAGLSASYSVSIQTPFLNPLGEGRSLSDASVSSNPDVKFNDWTTCRSSSDARAQSALVDAATREDCIIILRFAAAGYNIDASDDFGLTPLMIAARDNRIASLKTLIAVGADLSLKNGEGHDALMLATQRGSEEACGILCECGADTRAKDKFGNDALMLAAQAGYLNIAKWLVGYGADVRAVNDVQLSALEIAACSDDANLMEILLESGADCEALDSRGLSLLCRSAMRGNLDAIEVLCGFGANVNGGKFNFITPVMCAAVADEPRVIRMLHKFGADLHAPFGQVRGPLILALERRLHSVVRTLIDLGSQVEGQILCDSPLIVATRNGDVTAMKMLIDAGACVRSMGKGGQNAIHVAAACGREKALQFLVDQGALTPHPFVVERAAMIQAAMGGSARTMRPLIETPDILGQTALMLASGAGGAGLVNHLIKQGADPKKKDNCSLTSLHHAARGDGDPKNVLALLRAGAEIDAQTKLGLTPLLDAVHCGKLEVVKILVESGANLLLRDERGRTALILSVQEGHFDVMAALLHAGADPSAQDNSKRNAADHAQSSFRDADFERAGQLLGITTARKAV